jgi:hypothetical protein
MVWPINKPVARSDADVRLWFEASQRRRHLRATLAQRERSKNQKRRISVENRDYHWLSQLEIDSGEVSRHLSGRAAHSYAQNLVSDYPTYHELLRLFKTQP